MSRMGICRGGVRSRKKALMADQRGAVALEMPFVYAVLIFTMLLPLADLAIAGFQFVSARQALRNFGQYLQYNPPPNVTDLSQGDWLSTAQTKAGYDSRFPISGLQVLCNSGSCSDPTVMPKSYSYSTKVIIAPIVLTKWLCTGGIASGCTFTLSYSERFQ